MRLSAVLASTILIAGCGGEPAAEPEAPPEPRTALIELWSEGTPAFGIFAPNERERGARGPDGERLPPLYTSAGAEVMAQNPLLDYVFLNLEGVYDASAVSEVAAGLDSPNAVGEKTLLVRIPPISTDGAEVARARIAEVIAAGGEGIVLPHVRSAEEARLAVSFFEEAGADVWSPANPDGTFIAMLMIEDAGALAEAEQIADVPGYSVLACGIGSLSFALGSREEGEAGNQEVLAQAKRAGLPDMITANAEDVAQRIEEGFLGLLMGGPEADAAIQVGRTAAGR